MCALTCKDMTMGRFQVVSNALAVAGDRLVAIISVEPAGSVTVRDLASGRIHAVCAADLSAPPAAVRLKASSEFIICAATDSQWALAQRRKEALCGIDEKQNTARQVAQIAADFEVSRRTVFRWLALYRQAPQTSTLLPRARGTPVGAHRIDDRLDKLIAEVIQAVYLTKVRAKKEEVVRMVGLRCAALGLTPPSRKPILARLKELDPGQVAKARLQPGEAATQTTFVPGNYQVQHALEVVQIDHTPVDAIRRGRSQSTSHRSAMAHAGSRCRHPRGGRVLSLDGGAIFNFRGLVPVAGHPFQRELAQVQGTGMHLARLGSACGRAYGQRCGLHRSRAA